MTDAGESDFGEAGAIKSLRKGSSVSELVRSYDDGAGKRDRSESGDSMSAPTGRVKGGKTHSLRETGCHSVVI